MIIFENLERLLYIADIYRKDGNYGKALDLILTVAHELAKPIDFSQVSGIIEDEKRYNHNHDPKTGKFTSAPSGAAGVENPAGNGIVKIKNSQLQNGLPLKGKPNSIVDKTDESGKTLQRRKYGADGMAIVDYDTTDHNRPDTHPTGAHKHIFDYSKKEVRGSNLPLSEEELKDNSDIIRRGDNYHD